MVNTEDDNRVISVVIADDQVLFSQGLRRIIEISAPDIRVVGIVADGREVLPEVIRTAPDVVLMDVRMPGIDGVEATRQLHEAHPLIRIIMLTTFDNDEYVKQAVEYGAAGYLLKDIPPEELFDAIRAVHSHAIILSPAVARRLSGSLTKQLPDSDASSRTEGVTTALTDREAEVLELVMQEFDNRSIAERMNLSERTVRNYVSSIYSKLHVGNRFELLRTLRSPKR